MEYPFYDLFGKTIDGGSCRKTLALRPTRMKNIKTWGGHSRAMHWCYKAVESTLIFHFSLAFGLGLSANPPSPIFAVALFDSSFYTAPVLRARLLHCLGVSSLLLAAIWLLKNLGFFPSAPLLTLSRRECISLTWHCHCSHCVRYPLLLPARPSRWQRKGLCFLCSWLSVFLRWLHFLQTRR